MAPTRMALLDDYAGIAPKHFEGIEGLEIDSYPETLDPANPADLAQLVERLRPYPIISTMRERTPFPADLLRQLPNLRLLMTTAMRNLGIDTAAAAQHSITVTGTTGVRSTTDPTTGATTTVPAPYTTTQHSWALLLALCSRIPHDDRALKTSPTAWQSGLMIPLTGGASTLGIVGLGNLGVAFAKIAVQAFGMRVLAWSENLTPEKAAAAARAAGLPEGTFVAVGKERLLREADVVSLHNVLSDRSRGMIGKEELRVMKPGAVLVNTSRGGLIDEEALVEVLKEGKIGGFATDVFWTEPLPKDSVWRRTDEWAKSSVVLSPHMGYVNEGMIGRWYEEQAEIVKGYLEDGKVINKIN